MFHSAVLLAAAASIANAGSVVPRCTLGKGGPNVSCIAYGTLHLHEAANATAALGVLQSLIAMGITTIDTSDVYNSEPGLLGQALQLSPGLREKVEIISKMGIIPALGGFGYDSSSAFDTSCTHLSDVVQTYLTDLGTTYLDVVMIHREDYLMDIPALVQCVNGWFTAGIVRHFGVSNYQRDAFAALNAEMLRVTQKSLVANEIEISPLNPKALYDGTIPFHTNLGSTILAWGPLGGDSWGGSNRLFKVGSLNGDQRNARLHSALTTVAAALNDSEDVIAVAWLLRHPAAIIPILGSMNMERLANQTRAVTVAQSMTVQHWYHIADASGIPMA